MAFPKSHSAGREKKSDPPVRERKAFSFELESADESTGEFSGYAAVFGKIGRAHV